MRLFTKLFLSHLLIILAALGGLFLSAEVLAPTFIRHHVEQMAALIGPEGRALRPDLEAGMRRTLTSALLASLPLALLVAAGTAWYSSRRIVRSVALLSAGSRDVAGGQYARRLPEDGNDELTDLARNFNRMAGALERVEQGRVELISNVAHELRTPLSALRGYTEALTDGVLGPEQAAPAIRREVRVMERLASDLSLVSRVEAGQVELHATVFAPGDLLAAALERFAGAYYGRGVTLRAGDTSGLPPVHADFERALQVLSNLLSNALRHTPAGGEVHLRAGVREAVTEFSVRDTGGGIPAEHLPRVFERFYRGDPARTRGEGSGVGLTIARGLVEGMGGTIRVSSDPSGTVFTFTLPVAR